MNDDHRQTWGLIIDVLDVLEKHGYRRGDDRHTGRAVGLVGDLARIYEGTQEVPVGAYLVEMPEQRRARPGPSLAGRHQERGDDCRRRIFTILSALDEASDYKRDRAAGCADCADQSCGTCEHRLDAAQAYESLATRLQHAIDADTPGKSSRQATAGPPGSRVQPETAAEREAGQ